MKTPRNSQAKILNHDEGMGTASPEMVEKRARELAMIAGRASGQYTAEDWEQAKRELHGGHDDLANNGDGDLEFLVAADGVGAISAGHHAENHSSDNDGSLGEELVAEGLDEAEHEQMLEARRADSPSE